MNRRTWGLVIAAVSLAILLLLFRSASTPRADPVVVARVPATKPPPLSGLARLPKGLGGDPGKLSAPDGSRLPQGGRYDAETVETVRGRVAIPVPLDKQVRQGNPPERIILESAGEQIIVRLGPPRGLKGIGFERLNLAPGDEVEITGSRQQIAGGRHLIIASTLTKGDQTMVLRDGRGEPVWLPPRRGPRAPSGGPQAPSE